MYGHILRYPCVWEGQEDPTNMGEQAVDTVHNCQTHTSQTGTSRPLPKLDMIRGSELEMATRRIPDWRKNARIRQRRLYNREPSSNFAVATNREQFLSDHRQLTHLPHRRLRTQATRITVIFVVNSRAQHAILQRNDANTPQKMVLWCTAAPAVR